MAWIKKLLSPWGIALALLVAFLGWQGYGYWQDRGLQDALMSDPAFATPEMKLDFSKTIPYDPLSFLGRGAHAGLWTWTPKGLDLTPEGSKYFRMEGDQIISQTTAGKRRLARIQLQSTKSDGEQIDFFYEWMEISPAAAALLVPPPKLGEQYLAKATLVREGDTWRVISLETRDFDEPLGHLQDVAHGVRR
jgi:hypothetical protein